jgi:acetylornithine deacetylase
LLTEDQCAAAIVQPNAQTLKLIERLIGFNTVSRESNLELIFWIENYLKGLGISSRLSFNAERSKANLFATIGPVDEPGILLSGHTDVVPVTGQDWNTDPFVATVRDARVYGRGAADMKGFIAICLAAVPEMLAGKIAQPIHLGFTYDEEIGCLGVGGLIADMQACGIKPIGCIVGEPTDMRVVVGHKGRYDYRCRIRGCEAHSSLVTRGVNAIEFAARLIVYIRSLGDRLKQTEQRHYGFDVPYSTLQVGLIAGGIAANVVPKDCELVYELRNLPWANAENLRREIEAFAQNELVPEMRQIDERCQISFESLTTSPSFEIAPEEALPQYVQRLAASTYSKPMFVGFGTEAAFFQQAGIASVICGPGSIDQAHKPNEFVTFDQLCQGERFIRSLIHTPFMPEA